MILNRENHDPEDTMSIFKHHRRAERAGARARIMIGKRLLLHGLVAVTAVPGLVAVAAIDAVPASANTPVHSTPTLTLSNGTAPGQWVATGNTYAAGLSDVQILVHEVTDTTSFGLIPEEPTIESQSGLTTSSPSLAPYSPGGLFSAAGKTRLAIVYPPHSGAPGYTTEADNPLQCGRQYAAFTWDPIDGFVYSNVLTEAACS